MQRYCPPEIALRRVISPFENHSQYFALHRRSNHGFHNSVIRRVTATFLLLCMAFMVPASASSVRVCFIEDAVLLPGWDAKEAGGSEKPKCCPDCDGKEDGHCCMDVKKLPDAPEPSAPIFLSPVFLSLPTLEVCLPPCPVTEADRPFVPSTPIRGPDLPQEWRALLGVWNI
jgi:hypothetical protein